MKKTVILSAIFSGYLTTTSVSALATPIVDIEVVDVSRDCYEDEFMIARLPDGFGSEVSALEGMFSEMAAFARWFNQDIQAKLPSTIQSTCSPRIQRSKNGFRCLRHRTLLLPVVTSALRSLTRLVTV